MRETGTPRVLTVRTGCDAAAKQIVLTVSDSGPGVPQEIIERIFEPFFTTKPGTAGTGIGLALCRDIVRSHGGDIAYSENPSGGATFTVRLPLADRRAPAAPAARRADAGGETGTILVVDDDEEVALTLADVLRRQGHEVDAVFCYQDGVDRARQKAYDIIISDVRMPDAGGPELYQTLRSEIPELHRRMMFMTGDTLGTDLESLVAGTTIPVIEKPLDPPTVAAMIAGKLRIIRKDAAAE
jgi:CheY-like chemotaxis protein